MKKPYKEIPKFSLRGETVNCEPKAVHPFAVQPKVFSNPYLKSWAATIYERGNSVMNFASVEKWLPKEYMITKPPKNFVRVEDIDKGPELLTVPSKPCRDNTLPVIIKSSM